MPQKPAVSIALAAYNSENFLAEQLESFARQSRPADEIVVVNDCSQDNTAQILTSFTGKLPLKIHRNDQNLGYIKSFERALSLCTGEIALPADHDDIWHTEKIAESIRPFAGNPELLITFCNALLIDEKGEKLPRTFWEEIHFTSSEQEIMREGRAHEVLLRKGVAAGNSMAIHRRLLDFALPIPAGWSHDEWLMALASFSGGILPLPQPLLSYRQHGSQAIGVAHSSLTAKIKGRLKRSQKRSISDFKKEYEKWAALRERLQAAGKLAHSSELDQKIQFQEFCASYPESRGLRIPLALAALARGDYKKFGNGWATALRDILT